MSGNEAFHSTDRHQSKRDAELLLRETNHRCSNDLQLVVSLLALQSRRATNPEVCQALEDAMERVAALAQARISVHDAQQPSLESALQRICEALHSYAEPRSVLVSLKAAHEVSGLDANTITTLALVVNELATNAIKHAFKEEMGGHIRVTINQSDGRHLIVTVDDDGLPLPATESSGLGMGIVKRLMASIDGMFIPPGRGSKMSELRVPLGMPHQ